MLTALKGGGAGPSRQTSPAPLFPRSEAEVSYIGLPKVDCQLPHLPTHLQFFVPLQFFGPNFLDYVKGIEGLSLPQKTVFRELVLFAGRDGDCYPGVARIAAKAGCKARCVRYALETLEKRRYIARRFREGRTNLYFFPWLAEYGVIPPLHVVQGGAARDAGGAARRAGGGCTPCSHKTFTNSRHQKQTTTPPAAGGGCASLEEVPEEIQAAIELLAPSKGSPDGYRLKMYGNYYGKKLLVEPLLREAQAFRERTAQATAAARQEEEREKKAAAEQERKMALRAEKKEEISALISRFGPEFVVADMLGSGWFWEPGESPQHPDFAIKKGHTWRGMGFQGARAVLAELTDIAIAADIPSTLFSFLKKKRS